jgi:HSP20 family molecular chaperone IbpA
VKHALYTLLERFYAIARALIENQSILAWFDLIGSQDDQWGEHKMWLVCGTTFGEGKNNLLVRGTEGTEWVFCPSIKNMKRDKISISKCQTCRNFIRLQQTYIPQTRTTQRITSFKTMSGEKSLLAGKILKKTRGNYQSRSMIPSIAGVPMLIDKRQPLVDVFEERARLTILAELPGMDEKDVDIKTDGRSIMITAENAAKKYYRTIPLPFQVRKSPIKVSHKNSILQIVLKKSSTAKRT